MSRRDLIPHEDPHQPVLPMTWPRAAPDIDVTTIDETVDTIVDTIVDVRPPDDIPEWLREKLAAETEDDERDERLLETIRPCPGRLIVTKPEVAALSTEHRLASGLHIPDQAIRNLREFGLRTTIMRIHAADAPTLAEEGIVEGSTIIIPEFAGTPLWLGRETPWWIIAISEVMVVVEGDARAGGATTGGDR